MRRRGETERQTNVDVFLYEQASPYLRFAVASSPTMRSFPDLLFIRRFVLAFFFFYVSPWPFVLVAPSAAASYSLTSVSVGLRFDPAAAKTETLDRPARRGRVSISELVFLHDRGTGRRQSPAAFTWCFTYKPTALQHRSPSPFLNSLRFSVRVTCIHHFPTSFSVPFLRFFLS